MIKSFKINAFLKVTICLFGMLILSYSCKHKKKIQKTETTQVIVADTTNNKCRLDFKSSKTLTKHVKENELQYNWLYLKANVNTLFEGEDKGFDARVKLSKDSVMLITIELLTIDFAKVLITRDSIKMVDHYHHKYFKGDFNYINDLLNADLDFNVIQSVIIGNSAEFSEDDEKLKPVTDRTNCHYILSTERKRKLRKIEKGEADLKKALQIITLNPENYKIINNEFIEPTANRSFNAKYADFKIKDSVYAPYSVDIDIKAEKNMNIKIEYVRIEKNKPQKINFNIPKSYEPIKIQQKQN
jgi:hypothetical protein